MWCIIIIIIVVVVKSQEFMVYNQVNFITINLNIFIQLHSLIRLRSLSGDLEPLRSFTSLRARSLTPLLSLGLI